MTVPRNAGVDLPFTFLFDVNGNLRFAYAGYISDTLLTEYLLKIGIELPGDSDGDGGVDLDDVRAICRHLVKKKELTGVLLKAANVDGDDGIGLDDALTVAAGIKPEAQAA